MRRYLRQGYISSPVNKREKREKKNISLITAGRLHSSSHAGLGRVAMMLLRCSLSHPLHKHPRLYTCQLQYTTRHVCVYVRYIHATAAAAAAVIAQKPNQTHTTPSSRGRGDPAKIASRAGAAQQAAHQAAALATIRDTGIAHPASHAASTTRIAWLGLDFGRGGSASWKPDRSLARCS